MYHTLVFWFVMISYERGDDKNNKLSSGTLKDETSLI